MFKFNLDTVELFRIQTSLLRKLTNLGLVKIKEATFKDVIFNDCKMVGFPLQECNPLLLSVHFKRCDLQLALFSGLSLKQTLFNHCNLSKIDFTETQLTQAVFNNCNLDQAIFEATNLEKANFKTAYNLNIDLNANRLKGAKFSKNNLEGLLKKYQLVISE